MSAGKTKTETNNVTNTNSQQAGTTQDANYQVSTPIAPEGWEDFWNLINPGESGVTADQQAGINALKGAIGAGGRLTTSPTASLIGAAANGASGYGETFSLAQLQRQFPDLYKPIADVTAQTVSPERVAAERVAAERIAAERVAAQTVSAEGVTAQTGAALQNLYANPFEEQVVQSTLDDLERKYALETTARGSARQAAGAFGGSASALGDALATNDYLRTVAATSGGLRSQGFGLAAGLGMTDAERILKAAGMNQAAGLEAGKANQAASLQAAGMNQASALEAARLNQATGLQAAGMNQSTGLTAAVQNQDAALRAAGMNQSTGLTAAVQNQNNQTARQEFDVNAAYKGQDTRNQAAKDYAQLLASALGIDNQTALALVTAGGTGLNQGLSWLNAGSKLFGSESGSASTGAFNTTGSSTSTSNGTSTQSKSPGLLDIIAVIGKIAAASAGAPA